MTPAQRLRKIYLQRIRRVEARYTLMYGLDTKRISEIRAEWADRLEDEYRKERELEQLSSRAKTGDLDAMVRSINVIMGAVTRSSL